ncbi:MAG: hypothetical protein IJ439_03375 [Tyzzerella sp.]|nr:hypothetical protein [Tyzzerella sp.]
MKDKVNCEEYCVASLDLLAGKSIIQRDSDDVNLNHIRNIYQSWLKICRDDEIYKQIQIKIFSDNIVLAINCKVPNAAEYLLEVVSWMTEHFLRCGYKIRGGITKGMLYIDDILVWGNALVDAYILESEWAVNPRIIISENLIEDISERTQKLMIPFDIDFYILDYLKGYGKNAAGYLETISIALKRLDEEPYINEKIKGKNDYLRSYLLKSKQYWESR